MLQKLLQWSEAAGCGGAWKAGCGGTHEYTRHGVP